MKLDDIPVPDDAVTLVIRRDVWLAVRAVVGSAKEAAKSPSVLVDDVAGRALDHALAALERL